MAENRLIGGPCGGAPLGCKGVQVGTTPLEVPVAYPSPRGWGPDWDHGDPICGPWDQIGDQGPFEGPQGTSWGPEGSNLETMGPNLETLGLIRDQDPYPSKDYAISGNEPGATPIRYFFFLVNVTEVFLNSRARGVACHGVCFSFLFCGGRGAKGKGVTCYGF